MAVNTPFLAQNKSFRIFRVLDKNDEYFEKNMRLKKFTGVCFMPLARSRQELADVVKKIFGTKGYYQFMPNYLYNYKFVYQPYFIAGRKIISQGKAKIIREEAMVELPKLKTKPTFKYTNSRNAILDYTDQFNLMYPKNDQMLKIKLLKYAENIFPELLVRFGISYENPEKFLYTAKYQSPQVTPYLQQNHDTLIVPINVNVMNNKLVTMYLDYTKKIPLNFRKQPDTMKFLSLIRLIYRCYCYDKSTSDPQLKMFIEEISKHNVSFIFYNKRFAFTINFDELHSRNINFRQFWTMFKSKLILLISNNMGVQSDDGIDELITQSEKEDKENFDHVEQDINITVNKNAIDPETGKEKTEVTDKSLGEKKTYNTYIRDDLAEAREKKFNKIMKNAMTLGQVKTSLKSKTNDLLKLIDSKNSEQGANIVSGNLDDIKITKNKPIEPDEDKEITLKTVSAGTKVVDIKGVKVVKQLTKTVNANDENEIIQEDFEEDTEDKEEVILGAGDDDDIIFKEEKVDEEVVEDDENSGRVDDIPRELLEDNKEKLHIEISSDGNVTDEEKREVLKEIAKRNQPKRSEKQLRRIALVKDKYKSIKLNDDSTVEELLNKIDTTQIDTIKTESPNVIDKSVESCRLQDMESSYIKKTMKQDIMKTFSSFSDENKSTPLHMIDYKEEDTSDRFNSKTTITVKFEDENQKQHTIKVDIPKPNKDGTLFINGSKKVLKKQIILRPLVKISPDRLAIKSFYNKVLMYRQGTVLNRKVVIIKKLVDHYLKDDLGKDSTFTVQYGNNLKNNKAYITSIEYDELAKVYHKFIVGLKGDRTVVFFDQNEIRDEIKRHNLAYKFSVNKLPVAIDYKTKTVIDFDLGETNKSVGDIVINILINKSGLNDIEKIISNIKAPKRRIYSRVMIQSFEIPTIAFLGGLFGIRNVMKVAGLKFVFKTDKLESDREEKTWLSIKFKDGTLYYPEYPFENSLLMNGLAEMRTEDYKFDDFETELPYIEWLWETYRSRHIYKGWLGFKELFIDNITKELLETEKLPTDFLELFLYANGMLTDNSYINETEAKAYRIRGYEMISEALYKAISTEYNNYKNHETRKKNNISIPQQVIFKTLQDSQILENYDTINPINELKMKSSCTVKGNGIGGTKTGHGFGMNRRAFGQDCIGIYAETNTDNHTVGAVKSLTTNPRIINTRGYLDPTTDPEKLKNLTASEKMSPDELIMPGITKYDSPNRVAFSGAQFKHTLGISSGGDPMFVSSGYDKVAIKQIGDTFAVRCDEDCTIEEINEDLKLVTVINKNGNKQVYRYGTEYLKNSNFYLENTLVLDVKVGQKLKSNDVIAYSKEFFAKTPGGDLTMTVGKMAKVAIMDDYFTEEDSSLITEHFSKKFGTVISKCKQVHISTKSNIIKIREVGEYVKSGDVMMLFEDAMDDEISNVDVNQVLEMLGDVDESTMEKIAYHAPKASASGHITKIDMFWTGELENMSESCRKIVNKFIKEKKERIKYEEEQTGKPSNKQYEYQKCSGQFGMINGQKMEDDEILIEFYITHDTNFNVSDKIAFQPSVKSVSPEVVPENLCPYGETGKLDAVCGMISIGARQVNSPYFLGSLGKILFEEGKRIAEEYVKG